MKIGRCLDIINIVEMERENVVFLENSRTSTFGKVCALSNWSLIPVVWRVLSWPNDIRTCRKEIILLIRDLLARQAIIRYLILLCVFTTQMNLRIRLI